MYYPYEIHVAFLCLSGYQSHVGSCHLTEVSLGVGYGFRIIHAPVAGMVGVGLGAVAIIVELVAFAEIKQVKSAFNGVRVSVEAFHDSPVLGMREILDFRGGQCAGLHLLKHLLQCGASIVG